MSPDDIKAYFQKRVGKLLTHEVPHENGIRKFSVQVISLTGARISCEVSYMDHDRFGRPSLPVAVNLGAVKISLRGASLPADVFSRMLSQLHLETTGAEEVSEDAVQPTISTIDSIRAQVADLEQGIGLQTGHRKPDPRGVERLLQFATELPALYAPQVFSSRDGRLQARWFEGRGSLMAVFPLDGSPILLLFSLTRDGDRGRFTVTARTEADRDVVDISTRLGVRIVRG